MSRSIDAEGAHEEPISYFLDDVTHHGKSERTRACYERVLRNFEDFLEGRSDACGVKTASYRDCMGFVHDLRRDHSESTVATYASYLHRFYAYMAEVGVFDENPMALVMEEMDESINTDPARRDVSMAEMHAFVGSISHPLERAVVLTLLKTGMRAGELCNMDLREIHLEDAGVPTGPVGIQVSGRPNSLYVPSEPTRGAEYNGETRDASNKRRRDTIIPVDGELSRTLERYLAIRPDPVSDAEPLFVSTSGRWGKRLTPDMVHHVVETNARAHGWYADGGGVEQNVTPHYFRHFFTTHMRDRIGDRGVVKYLRGDVAQDVIDTYTHDWGDRIRSIYLENVYSLL
jgi:site-specific recombinase XerD